MFHKLLYHCTLDVSIQARKEIDLLLIMRFEKKSSRTFHNSSSLIVAILFNNSLDKVRRSIEYKISSFFAELQ
jgi:hypothetical protein